MKITKALLSLVLVTSLAGTTAFADVFADLSSLDKDKYVHFGAGVLISHVSYPLFLHATHNKASAMWYSLGLTVLLGVAKEASDAGRTGFDGGDLAATVLGGCTIVVVTF